MEMEAEMEMFFFGKDSNKRQVATQGPVNYAKYLKKSLNKLIFVRFQKV